MKKFTLLLSFALLFMIAPLHAQNDELSDEEFDIIIENIQKNLVKIVNDFPNNYKNVANKDLSCKLDFEVIQGYFDNVFLSEKLVFVLDFGEAESYEDAEVMFENVTNIVEEAPFDFEIYRHNETATEIAWRINLMKSMQPEFIKMEITARLVEYPFFSLEGTSYTYGAVINVKPL